MAAPDGQQPAMHLTHDPGSRICSKTTLGNDSCAQLISADHPLADYSKANAGKESLRDRLGNCCAQTLILPKLIYLTLNMAIYATHNYTAMYFYKMWGIQVYQFGAVSSLAAVQFIGALFWGHLADRTGRHKSILILCTVFYGFFFSLLHWMPFKANSDVLYRVLYSAFMYGLSCFFVSALFPLVDTQIFAILAKDPSFSKEVFGRQRLWGSIGHALVTLLVGAMIFLKGYIGIFLVLICSCIAFIIFVLFGIPTDLPPVQKGAHRHGQHHASTPAAANTTTNPNSNNTAIILPNSSTTEGSVDLPKGTSAKRWASTPAIRLLVNPHFFFLIVVIMCAGYTRAIMSSFLVFYMQAEMDQGELMVALVIGFRTISEIAVYFFNKQLLRTIGIHWMLIIAQISGILRCLAYSLLPPTGDWFYLSFGFELLKGISTGCLISAGVRMANDIAPEGCENTAQSYVSGVYSGLSLAVGGALGGLILYLLPNHSVASLFRITFYMGLVALLLCILKYSLVDRAILVPRSWRPK